MYSTKKESITGNFSYFFKTLDQFSVPINLRYKSKHHFQSTFGATLSVLMNIVLLVYFIYLLEKVFNKEQASISESTKLDI